MSTVTKLINNNFGGIRRKNSSFSNELITCSDCQNVELFFTRLNSGVGIRTASGNVELVENLIPDGEEVIEMFESILHGNKYLFIYTISSTVGKLYYIGNMSNPSLTLIKGDLSLTYKLGRCACGADFAESQVDMFIFSNGADIVYVKYEQTGIEPELEDSENIHLIDDDDRDVMGLGLKVFDSRLWVFNNKSLWYSEQGDCRNFTPNTDPTDIRNPGYIDFVKDITAIYPYLGSLAVFHEDSSSIVSADALTSFAVGDESPGGCAGYDSLVFHGTDLYFYDHIKKGIFSFQQIVNGDKTLSNNIAVDLQDELTDISSNDLHKIKAVSVITADRNEIWMLIPGNYTYPVTTVTNEVETTVNKDASLVLIFDYIRGEWVKRKCQKINTVVEFKGKLYSAGDSVYEEYTGETFNGDFIENYYICSEFNMGEDNTMKITKMPPRLTVDGNYSCNFYVYYTKNYQDFKNPKEKLIKTKQASNLCQYNAGFLWDNGNIYATNNLNTIVKIPSITFKTLKIEFKTKNEKQSFAIKSIEFSKLKVKQV